MNLSTATIISTCLLFCIISDPTDALPDKIIMMRARRSFAPMDKPQVPAGNKQDDRGNVDVDIHRERGVGTVVSGRAEGNVYRSPSGNTRVDAYGNWQRVYDGPARGQRNHNAGVRFSHRW